MSGGCQCGAVRYSAGGLLDNPHVCHCRMCQKATGNFFAALVGVPRAALTWTRGTPAVFESSAGIERGFCRDCGTPLFYHRRSGGHVSITIGSFDDPGAIPLVSESSRDLAAPQLGQLGHLPFDASREEEDPEAAARIAASSRQHPDHDTQGWHAPD